jgi:hypothetical protein
MATHSAQPDTVEEVQSAIQRWLDAEDGAKNRWFRFEKAAQQSAIKVFISHSARDLKVEMHERLLFFELNGQELKLNLEKFVVWTAFEDQKFCVHIDRDPEPEHHFLISALRQFEQTKHPAFYTRVLRAIRGLEDDLASTLIDEATAAPTDHLVVLEALSSAPWTAELADSDPLLAAKLRGLQRRQEMLKIAGGALTSEQVGEVLTLSRQGVDKRRLSNQLLALTQGRRGYSYPAFQFEDGKTLHGLEEVLKSLSAIDPWMQLNFFTTPNERLVNKNPMDALRLGKVDEVVRIASTYGEQGAM